MEERKKIRKLIKSVEEQQREQVVQEYMGLLNIRYKKES
jgi:negative regulator of replication initiation